MLKDDLEQLQRYFFKTPIKKEAVQPISQGLSPARKYRIEDSGKTYLARFIPSAQSLTKKEKECLLAVHASQIKIGPKVYYQNPQQGIIITEFIQGRTANYNDMTKEPIRNLIVANIKKLHQSIQLDFPRASTLTVRIQENLKRANSAILQQQLQALELIAPLNSLCSCEVNTFVAALIHGDLVPNNILIDKKNIVYFIDWTDAGIGDSFSDISWHAMFYPVSQHNNLLHYYFADNNTFMHQKLLCYYCLRLFLFASLFTGQAKKIVSDYDHRLIDIIKQSNLPTPYQLMKDIFTDKITLSSPDIFLLIVATMLHFLAYITKTDTFLAAIEELSQHD